MKQQEVKILLRVYNTLTGEKEDFKPLEANKVKIYVCGLTVQDYAHVGHIRSAINYDVIRRYFEYKDYEVTFVQNFTDINKKIVNKAEEEGLSPMELAEKYKQAYLDDIDQFNIKRADFYCTVSENIENIIEFVQTLINKDYAYEINGNVYFSVEKFDDYGKLSGRKIEEMEAGSRVEVKEEKNHPLDFALWKKVDKNVHISWDSPWGQGWPGWHIECSAMCMDCLGDKIDMHGGGTDLIFPHHENEIAQSEAYSGQKPFVKYWVHNGTVNLKGEKMSKSVGNFFTARELLKKFTGQEIRYFLLTTHYRKPIDFSLEDIQDSAKSLDKLRRTKKRLKTILDKDANNNIEQDNNNKITTEFEENLNNKKDQFLAAMEDDFNTAQAIGFLHEIIRHINRFIHKDDFVLNEKTRNLLNKADKILDDFAEILGISLDINEDKYKDDQLFKELVNYILELRNKAREDENWELADKIRDDLGAMGIEVKDTPRGVEWNIKRKRDRSGNNGS